MIGVEPETAGITRAEEGINGLRWNILGQIYVPKQITEQSFSWHAILPAESFVPPHVHTTQNEYLYILEGKLDFLLDGRNASASAGDLVRLPMGKPHGIFNRSGAVTKCLFWVSPTRKLCELFAAIHDMPEQKPEEVVALAAKHEVEFVAPH